jgi:hypothetical protein
VTEASPRALINCEDRDIVNSSLKTLDRIDTTASQTPLAAAQEQFDRIADRLGLDADTKRLLRSPMKEHRVVIPVRMDDESVQVAVSSCCGR